MLTQLPLRLIAFKLAWTALRRALTVPRLMPMLQRLLLIECKPASTDSKQVPTAFRPDLIGSKQMRTLRPPCQTPQAPMLHRAQPQ
jgi:hypothetical protein